MLAQKEIRLALSKQYILGSLSSQTDLVYVCARMCVDVCVRERVRESEREREIERECVCVRERKR